MRQIQNIKKPLTLEAPTTKLWATFAINPSTWTPRSLQKKRRQEKKVLITRNEIDDVSNSLQILTATQLSWLLMLMQEAINQIYLRVTECQLCCTLGNETRKDYTIRSDWNKTIEWLLNKIHIPRWIFFLAVHQLNYTEGLIMNSKWHYGINWTVMPRHRVRPCMNWETYKPSVCNHISMSYNKHL